MTIEQWSTTAASNASGVTSINFAEGQAPSSLNDSARQLMADVAAWYARFPQSTVENLTIVPSVGSNALTVALKTKAGTDPSATDAIKIPFRSATAGTGDYTIISVTAATSLVISSGSTLGTTSGNPARIWIVGFNDGGTFRLGAVNCYTTTGIVPLRDYQIASSTAEGGAGAADSAGVIYTGTAVSSKAMKVLGYIECTEATAGTWATNAAVTQLFSSAVALPGATVQHKITQTGTVNSGSTNLPLDDTTPQKTEGDEYMTLAITPTSAINVLNVKAQALVSVSSASNTVCGALFQDANADALCATALRFRDSNTVGSLNLNYHMAAGTTSATTMKFRAGSQGGLTTTFNGISGTTQYFNGLANSFMQITEIMA
jgi:hypothetical protein